MTHDQSPGTGAPGSGATGIGALSTGGLIRRILLTIFLLSLLGGAGGFFVLLRNRALQTAASQARLMLTTGLAVSDYTDDTVFPLLDSLPADRFYDQLVPFHAVQAVFRRVQARYPAYSFREPVLNPTSLDDRPTPFDVELTERFRADPALAELQGVRRDAGQEVFYLARPIRVADPSCLTCHSTPERAPKAMLARYGPVNGFGWTLGETVGVLSLTVPVADELRGTTELAVTLGAGLMAIFALTYVALTASLGTMLVRPLRALAAAADVASRSSAPAALPRSGVGEIHALADAIAHLRLSLAKALAAARSPAAPPAPPPDALPDPAAAPSPDVRPGP